jgi:ADP-ribose pyrophosphatase YjhB (NUDIX family)
MKMSNIRIRVAGILMKEDKILLVRHEKNKNSYWLLPGGGVEFGETAAEALIREFQEEVGLAIQIKSLVLVHDSIPPDKHRQVLNLYYLVTSLNFDLTVTPDAVLRDADFFPLSKLKDMKINPDVKNEILEGIQSGWKSGGRYLGNRWKE